jgi:L-alanine-DL-glutamate epimerase-like enolase superfamily enzyme
LDTLYVKAESWPIAGSFTIARGSKTTADVIVVELTQGQTIGWGEGVPYKRYGETVWQCREALEFVKTHIEDGEMPDSLPMAARNALDSARWDLRAKLEGTPVWKLAGLKKPKPLITAYTISLDTPEAMAAHAARVSNLPLLKIKLGKPGDDARLAAIRASVPKARLIIDANEGWTAEILPMMFAACKKYGVELVEQPLPAEADDILTTFKRDVLICADESAHDTKSLKSLRGKYDAVNIKLDKTGGLTEALEMAKAAKAEGFKLMVGCMVGTSLSMAPAFLVAQMADFVDLDGPLLLAADRDSGIAYKDGLMQPPLKALWG